jgi:plasmid stability protein
MARLTIRRLNDEVAASLRRWAAAAGHSMEQEAREILAAAVLNREQVIRRLRARLASYGARRLSDSGELIREMRDARGGGA